MLKSSNISSLGFYKELFSENRENFAFVKIVDLEVAMDGSSYNVMVDVWGNDEDQTLVKHIMDPQSSSHPQKDEVWFCCFVDGRRDQGVLLGKFYNEEFKMHPKTKMGETVIGSHSGKNINLTNNDEAMLDQWAVLGPTLVMWLNNLSEEIKKIGQKVDDLKDDLNALKGKHDALVGTFNGHNHGNGNMGAPTAPPISPSTDQGTDSSVTTQDERDKIDELNMEEETTKFLSDLVVIQERDLKGEEEK